MRNWNTALGLLVVGILAMAVPTFAQETTVGGTNTPAATTVDATAPAAAPATELMPEIMKVIVEHGLPTDTSKEGLITYGIFLLLALGGAFAAWKWGAENPYVAFGRDAANAIHQVYIDKVQPLKAKGEKIDTKTALGWAWDVLNQIKSTKTAKLIEEKGKAWVMGELQGMVHKLTGGKTE
jgi:hypothetical protein